MLDIVLGRRQGHCRSAAGIGPGCLLSTSPCVHYTIKEVCCQRDGSEVEDSRINKLRRLTPHPAHGFFPGTHHALASPITVWTLASASFDCDQLHDRRLRRVRVSVLPLPPNETTTPTAVVLVLRVRPGHPTNCYLPGLSVSLTPACSQRPAFHFFGSIQELPYSTPPVTFRIQHRCHTAANYTTSLPPYRDLLFQRSPFAWTSITHRQTSLRIPAQRKHDSYAVHRRGACL